MDNSLNEIRRKISDLRLQMMSAEQTIRAQIDRDEDCTEAWLRLMAMRTTMLGLIRQRERLGGRESLPTVEQRIKADHR